MNVHIGEKIKAKAKEVRMGPTELATKVDTTKQNIYSIYKRRSIDCELLYRISKALAFDFFVYYSDAHYILFEEDAAGYEKQPPLKGKQDPQKLQKALDDCQKKYTLLKELYVMAEGKGPLTK